MDAFWLTADQRLNNQRVPSNRWKYLFTVDELFAKLKQVRVDPTIDKVTARFDTKVGYPTFIFIDEMVGADDDEMTYEILSVEELW